jgi:hypothetical protein
LLTFANLSASWLSNSLALVVNVNNYFLPTFANLSASWLNNSLALVVNVNNYFLPTFANLSASWLSNSLALTREAMSGNLFNTCNIQFLGEKKTQKS